MSTTKKAIVYGDYGYDRSGKRIRKKFTGATREEALVRKAEYERERAIGLHTYSDRMTVSEWIEVWEQNYLDKIHGQNAVSYRIYIQRLIDEIGSMRIRDVRNIHLRRCMRAVAGMSRSSITKYRMVIRQVFSRARQNKVIADDPSEYTEMPEGTRGKHRALESWEIDHVLANWRASRAGLWMMIMMLAGLRRGEMIALDWDAVDIENRTITVRRSAEIISNTAIVKPVTKTEAGMRAVPICTPLYDALNTIPEQKRSGPVCVDTRGNRLSGSSFANGMASFNKVMEQLLNGEAPDPNAREPGKTQRKSFSIRAHDLRYTFATLIYESGVDVKTAMFYLGHADVRMTMNLYTQFSTEKRNAARAQAISFLDKRLAGEADCSLDSSNRYGQRRTTADISSL